MVGLIELIQASLVPVVLISGACLLALGIQERYGRVIDRIRIFDKEIYASQKMNKDWLESIESQMRILIKRGKMLRNAMFWILLCVMLIVFSTVLLTFNLLFNFPEDAVTAIFIFSLLSLFIGTLFAVIEIFVSYRAVIAESKMGLKYLQKMK